VTTTASRLARPESDGRGADVGVGTWTLAVLAVSLLPVLGVFTTTRIFYVRDLSFFFWSRHLWLRHTVFAGQAPWWDPYVAGGQSAIADALNQLLMPLALAVRLLPSDVVSFNLWVALPLPIAALGMFVFLRRRGVGAPAAALGAVVFALSGPIVSMLNLPNLAWSVAFLPWVLAGESVAWIAIAFGLQALCGEPVTWVATGAIAAGRICSPAPGITRRAADRIRLLAALGLGALLASAQLVPTMMASVRAHRGALATPDFWSLHPLSLWETVAPHLFGNYYDAFLADVPWMGALNFGRDPFFYSYYLGPFVLVLAAGGVRQFRRNAFWIVIAAVFTIAALGGYTPVYPLLRRHLPALMYFRFPVKYIVFAVFAVAVLAADGWREQKGSVWLPAAAGSLLLAVTGFFMVFPARLHALMFTLAVDTHLKEPDVGAAFLSAAAPPLALRCGALLVAAALLVALSRVRPYAWRLLAVVACVDLLAASIGLNPTLEASRLSPPGWFTAAAGDGRVYVAGRARGYMNTDDPDAPSTWQIPAEATAIQGRMELNANLPMMPSGWRVREALSYDLPYLWPAEYEATLRRFEAAPPAARDAFLRRSGVRWCVLSQTQQSYPGQASWRHVADVPDWNMRVFDCHPGASRLAFADAPRTIGGLFDTALPDTEAAGEAHFIEDRPTAVTVEATLTRASLLVLRDSYADDWTAEVDGTAAPILRANGLQRGVALAPGHHLVRFRYRPRDLLTGLTISIVAIAFLAGPAVAGRSASRRRLAPRERGFTLIELMIVLAIMAIVMAIAFTAYRNMKSRGNEASALASLRSIAAAQAQFSMTCGNMKYAVGLPALGKPVPTTGEAFLSPDLTAGETIEKSGYSLHMAGKPIDDAPPACNGAAVAEGFAATADPLQPGVTGAVFYGVNADRILYRDEEKSFKEDLPEKGAAPHGQEAK
jgi:prepilin-type N-terminal cleavage/methylation domain-containing protein